MAAKGDVELVGWVKLFALTDDVLEVEPPVATVAGVNVAEGSGKAILTVSLDAASTELVSVDYVLKDDLATAGSDYQAASGTIAFNPGQTSKTIEIELVDDGIYELAETFIVELDNPKGITLNNDAAVITITNDDELPELAINSVVVTEDSGMVVSFKATLSQASGVAVTVDFTAKADTAIEGDDFTTVSGTLTFEPGETSKTIAAIPIIEDSLDEIDEMFTIELSNATNAEVVAGSGTATIEDNDDPPELSVGNVTVAEGDEDTTSATFAVTLSQASGEKITVDYATEDNTAIVGEDYEAVSGRLTFARGETAKAIAVEVAGDNLDEIDESFLLNLDNAVNATFAKTQATATITDDDDAPAAAIDSVSLAEGDQGKSKAVFTVTLDHPSGKTIAINYATEDSTALAGEDYTAQSGTITFEPGETTKTIEVEVIGDLDNEVDEAFTVNLSDPTFVTISPENAQGTATIINNDFPLELGLSLAKDTGADSSDRISQDATVTGTVENLRGGPTLSAGLNDTESTDISDVVRPDGSFTLGIEQLQQLNGGDLGDGAYTLELTATDSQTGEVIARELTFTLDATATTLNLISPLVDGAHSSKPRLIGQLDDTSNLEYVLDDGIKQQIEIDEEYKFDAAIGEGQLTPGNHNLVITSTDTAGNITETEVSFTVEPDEFIIVDGTDSWGAKDSASVLLGEQNGLLSETSIPIELGQAEGSRSLKFELAPLFDNSNNIPLQEDQLLVYLVDPNDTAQTLLDNGTPASAVFSLAG